MRLASYMMPNITSKKFYYTTLHAVLLTESNVATVQCIMWTEFHQYLYIPIQKNFYSKFTIKTKLQSLVKILSPVQLD